MSKFIQNPRTITIGVFFIWLFVSIGTTWWLWKHYQQITTPNNTEIQASIVKLDTKTLNKAIELLK